MISNLNINLNKIEWVYNGKRISIDILNSFFASNDDELKVVKVESGENYIADRIYYFSYDGKILYECNLLRGIIKWNINGKNVEIKAKNIQCADISFTENRVFIISQEDGQELIGYTLEGVPVFKRNDYYKLKLLYFVHVNRKLQVVCENSSMQDSYNRDRYNYDINIINGELSIVGMAY